MDLNQYFFQKELYSQEGYLNLMLDIKTQSQCHHINFFLQGFYHCFLRILCIHKRLHLHLFILRKITQSKVRQDRYLPHFHEKISLYILHYGLLIRLKAYYLTLNVDINDLNSLENEKLEVERVILR